MKTASRVAALALLTTSAAWTPAPAISGRAVSRARDTRCRAMTEIGSEQAFDDIVQKTDKLVVVDFATTWCGPCKVMEPKMNQISEEYTDAEFYKVVGDASADASKLMKREGVRTVPSFHFWKGNSRVEVINGANIEAVTKAVQKHKDA
ncbi:unnamed protein product [Pelagomonas calceolata]|uniref:Thioredoxin domain-containing protein n=1 Tax=Pelagomonas calceolata TaxID=35677 RepID=A0A8J2SPR0_9STRA|nr:unnamed protein product [Pelagomonas calceolata]|mmetsp:Transcript_23160/g.69215  ORF Transcript_23160/g.69215 Transcript_23160/m.69215 type:complete len:149 (+) Transcript_23160:156-602(+)